jgi:hypothetical protein
MGMSKMNKDQLRNAIAKSVKQFKSGNKQGISGVAASSQQQSSDANVKPVRKHLRKV